jgi:hypothetical protein
MKINYLNINVLYILMSTIQVKKMQVANMKSIEESLGTDYDDTDTDINNEKEEEDEDVSDSDSDNDSDNGCSYKEEIYEEEDKDEYYDITDQNEQLAYEARRNGDKETFYRLQAIMVRRLNRANYEALVRQSILDLYMINYTGRRGTRKFYGQRYL